MLCRVFHKPVVSVLVRNSNNILSQNCHLQWHRDPSGDRNIEGNPDHLSGTCQVSEAINDKGMVYCEELSGIDQYQDMKSEDSMDFGIQNLSKEDSQAMKMYKMQPIGPWRL